MSLNVRYEQKLQDIAFLGGHNIQCMPHLHRELELICLLEGEVVAYADSVRCELHAGDIFLVFPNQIHSYEKRTPETHVGFIFKPDLLPEMMEIFTMGTPRTPVIKGGANMPQIRALIESLSQTRESTNVAHLSELRRGYLLALCAQLLPHMTVVKLSVGDSETLRTIVSFCTQNFAENLSLSLLEEKLHLNKYYISHLFSRRLGLGFTDYINSLRVSEACRYLLNSDHSITEIGSLVGFNTPRTFNRAFMRQMGMSPTEYRRRRLDELNEHIKNAMEPHVAPTTTDPCDPCNECFACDECFEQDVTQDPNLAPTPDWDTGFDGCSDC